MERPSLYQLAEQYEANTRMSVLINGIALHNKDTRVSLLCFCACPVLIKYAETLITKR